MGVMQIIRGESSLVGRDGRSEDPLVTGESFVELMVNNGTVLGPTMAVSPCRAQQDLHSAKN